MKYKLPEILEGCKQEKTIDQRQLYESYYGYAYSVCYRFTENEGDALECLNDGFVKIFRNISSFELPGLEAEGEKAFMGWLKRIMINTCLNNMKSRKRKVSWGQMDKQLENEYGANDNSITDISYKELLTLIQQLSPAYRNTFNLYVIEGLSHEEVAGMLGISVGTSKSNLLKARKTLRKMLEKYYAKDFQRYE